MTDADCDAVARALAGDRYDELMRAGELDMAANMAGRRIRINLFRQMEHTSAALRLLSDTIPALSSLGLPPAVERLTELRRGIVIVTGETGSGKSTTLAAMIDSINHSRAEHVITLEDPVEYIYKPDKSIFNQREIGRDTESYANGLRAALREDPDIILVGEMRDLDTIETALTAAETGHLVFATLHTGSAAESIDRIVDVFPEERQKQIRMQLSMTLRAVLSQQLLPTADGKSRVAACELMIVTYAIKNLIREGKTPQIENTISTTASEGAITMDNAVLRLYRDKKITRDTALLAAHDAEYVKKNLLY
jgi:twitching motility protein PilT